MCFPIQPLQNRHGIVDDMRSRLIGVVKWIKLTVLLALLTSAIDDYACQSNVEIVPDQLFFFFGTSPRILRVCIKRLGDKDVFLFIPFLCRCHPHSDYSVHCKQVLPHFMTDNFMEMKLSG
ncbi:hypothetical protein HUJ05_004621 [Dendroctonus ponderosae]|nr:hypothetical protein HUJ05_004621 [Dendroctonus ponderosae]